MCHTLKWVISTEIVEGYETEHEEHPEHVEGEHVLGVPEVVRQVADADREPQGDDEEQRVECGGY